MLQLFEKCVKFNVDLYKAVANLWKKDEKDFYININWDFIIPE